MELVPGRLEQSFRPPGVLVELIEFSPIPYYNETKRLRAVLPAGQILIRTSVLCFLDSIYD